MNEKDEIDYPPAHYIHAAPSPVLGIIATIIALVLMAAGIAELRRAAPNETSLTIGIATADSSVAESIPVLSVTADSWAINSQPVKANDLLFRLSAIAAKSPAIIVEHPPELTADRLTQALEQVNRAGFTQVAMRTEAHEN